MAGFYTQQLDFCILDLPNPKTIVFVDASDYFEEPEKPLLSVTPPFFNQVFQTLISARQVNTLNSNNLKMTSFLNTPIPMDLSDGIYKFEFGICPYTNNVVKYNLRTAFLDDKISQIYNTLSCNEQYNDETIQKELINIYIAKESAKANATIGNVKNAQKDFNIACSKVDRILDKLNSNGLQLFK